MDSSPYKKLWAAVIGRAISDLGKKKESLAYSQAEYWLFNSDNKEVGSLFWICEHLGLDVDYIRKQAAKKL